MTSTSLSLFDPFHRNSVGFSIFDRLGEDFFTKQNFPPYNIQKVSETDTVIDMALAGYKRDDLNIQVTDDILEVFSTLSEKKESKQLDYTYRGLAQRSFRRQFALQEGTEVIDAKFEDGMLRVTLRTKIPESKKTRLIPIS